MSKIIILILLITGCATYRPITDMQGVDYSQYSRDLRDCQQYAEQINVAGNTAINTGIGAAVGSLFGAIAGAWMGNTGMGAGMGASLGAATGLTQGLSNSTTAQKEIVKNCMTGRGYNVLN